KNEFVMNLIWTQDRSAALEIACAPGSLLKRLSDQFDRVHGIEVDETYGPEIKALAGSKAELWFGYFHDISKSLFGPEHFSLIVGLDIFEHSHEPEAFLAECARLLKPDGQLLLMAPMVAIGSDPLPDRSFHPIEHVYIHSYENLFLLLCDAGFASIKNDRWCPGHETVTARKL
ncbi:MAG: class I SAM-dependent methyltransferase, partial [Acidobacteria bacterium]|nr:class I SAM-dependent methyltransferase [Acidobacteriota bacterium]